MTGYVITWNNVASTTIPEFVCQRVIRQMLGSHRGTFVEIPGRPGSWYFPEQRGRRTIELECFIMADSFPTERRDVIETVADWLEVNAEARLQISDMPGRYYDAVLLDNDIINEWRELGEFTIPFSVAPYAFDLLASEVIFSQTVDDDWTYNFGLMTQVYPVIEITNTDVTNLEGFFFTINNSQIWYTGTLPAGQAITINSIGQAVLAGDGHDEFLTGEYQLEDMLTSAVEPVSVFPILVPGLNTLEIEGEQAVTVDIKIRYRKAYRS